MTKTNVPIELTDNDSSISIDPTEHLNNVNVETLNFDHPEEEVRFPLSQSAPNTSALMKQAELSRRVFLYLIEKYNLSPSVILHSLYAHSGNVAQCEEYLSDPTKPIPWNLADDHLILTDSNVSRIIEERGLEALNERRSFLHQVCYEAIGNCSEITSKLK